MKLHDLPRWRILLAAGALAGLAASILLPYRLVSCLLLAGAALCWLAACILARVLRPEFGAAIKFTVAAAILFGVTGFVQDNATVLPLLLLGCAALYFIVALVCAGCHGITIHCPPADRLPGSPAISSTFEGCAVAFALCQMLSASVETLSFLAELCSMSALAIGFGLLLRFFLTSTQSPAG